MIKVKLLPVVPSAPYNGVILAQVELRADLIRNVVGDWRIPVFEHLLDDLTNRHAALTGDRSAPVVVVHHDLDFGAGGSGGEFVRRWIVESVERLTRGQELGRVDVLTADQIKVVEHRVDREMCPTLELTDGRLEEEAQAVVRLLRGRRTVVAQISGHRLGSL